jgi:hypothetical protein
MQEVWSARFEDNEVINVANERSVLNLNATAPIENVEELRLVLMVVVRVLRESRVRVKSRNVVVISRQT